MRVRVEKAVYGGDGLARDEAGKAVLVPSVLPGEVVEIAGIDGGRGRLDRLEVASNERVAEECRHFGRCGGCQYQEASYELQLRMKVDILSETLERAGLRDRPRVEVLAGEPWGYRNRIRLRVEEVDGDIRVGYNLRQTNEFLPIAECSIAAPVLWRAAVAMEGLGWMRGVAEVEIFCTADGAEVQVSMTMREGRTSGFARFCRELRAVLPELVGVGAAGESWGKEGLRYVVEGKRYWVSRGGFFQVNRFLLPGLVRLVTGGRKGLMAWDLFAGVGLFSRVLAEGFAEVVAVETNPQAVKDLGAVKVGNIRGLAGSVGSFLRAAAVGRERPDLVVLDPPRAGLGRGEAALLAGLQVPQIVYVSCDPTTLARDLRVMVDSGYDLAELHLVDLFPQTYHLETVAVLERSAR